MVYSNGITEHQALDNIHDIDHPYEMCWSLIYRKLTGMRGCSFVTDDEYVTFGILIADARQGEAREYILNYLNVFNKSSGKYFDFFIPGYNNDKWSGGREIRLGDNKYYFCENLFVEFCENLYTDFGTKYTFNPMLILMTIKKNIKVLLNI